MLPQDRMCWLSMHRSIWQCWVFDVFCRDVVFETITAAQIFLNIFGEPPVCFTVCSPVLFLAATSVHPDHVWLTCCWTVVWWAVVLLCCSLLFSVVLCYTGQPLRRQTAVFRLFPSSKELEQHIFTPPSAWRYLPVRDCADVIRLPCFLLLCSVCPRCLTFWHSL